MKKKKKSNLHKHMKTLYRAIMKKNGGLDGRFVTRKETLKTKYTRKKLKKPTLDD